MRWPAHLDAGCEVSPRYGDTIGAICISLPCRKCPILSTWGWIFPPKTSTREPAEEEN